MLSIYPACFFKEENGYSVIFPDLGIATCGDNLEDSVAMAIDCLAGYIYSCQECNDCYPPASHLQDINILSIAKEIYDDDTDYSEAFVNMISVDVATYAKEHFEKSVKKTLTIPSWLNDKALEMGLNFSQVLQEALLAKIKA